MISIEKYRDYLVEHGISQAHVARKSGLNTAKLNRILSLKQTPTIEDFALMCQAIGVQVENFIVMNN